MEFVIPRSEFLKGLYIAQGVVEKRSTKAILSNVRLDATNEDGLCLAATDLEISLSASYAAEVREEGSITVNARDLYDIVRGMPERSVHVKMTDGSGLEVSCGKIIFRLVGMPAADFPEMPSTEGARSFVYPASTLASVVDLTVFAVATDEARYYLGGVYLEIPEGQPLRAVATDGHRLSLVDADMPEDSSLDLSKGVILPRKVLTELRKVIETKEGHVEVGIMEKHVVFRYGTVTLSSLLIEGDFPDYRQVLPKMATIEVAVRRQDLLSALKRVTILSADRTWPAKLSVEGDMVVLASNNPSKGEARETIEVIQGEGEITIGVNAHYLMEVLQVVDATDVQLGFTDELNPCMLKPVRPASESDAEGDEGAEKDTGAREPRLQDYSAVVMPMRI